MEIIRCDGCGKTWEHNPTLPRPIRDCRVQIGNTIVTDGHLCQTCAERVLGPTTAPIARSYLHGTWVRVFKLLEALARESEAPR